MWGFEASVFHRRPQRVASAVKAGPLTERLERTEHPSEVLEN